MKTCFLCKKTKTLDEFYSHPMMGDGHLGKCKDCSKAYGKAHRKRNRDRYVAYEKDRWKTRKTRDRARKDSPKYKLYKAEYVRSNRDKVVAHNLVHQAVQNGILVRTPYERCGASKTEGHHHDYSKPLVVTWLCVDCHRLEHAKLRGTVEGTAFHYHN